MGELPLLLQNSKWKVREGTISLWFDKFVEQGLLCEEADEVVEPSIKIKELFVNDRWDVARLEMLGIQKEQVMLCCKWAL